MEDRGWKMEDGRWKMEERRWKIKDSLLKFVGPKKEGEL